MAAISAQDYLRDAKSYLQRNDTKAAVIQLKNALRLDAANPEVRLLLGESYLRLRDGAAAEKELKHARDAGLPESRWLDSLGRAYLMQKKYRALLEDFQPDGLNVSDQAHVHALHGQAYLGLYELDNARTAFDRGLSLDRANVAALVGAARVAMIESRFAEAHALLTRALAKEPGNVDAWTTRGETYHSESKFKPALDAFEQALRASPDELRARLGRAATRVARGEIAGAKSDLERAQAIAPDHPTISYLNGAIALQGGDLVTAEAALTRALIRLPNHMPTHLLLGQVYYQTGKAEQAVRYLTRYVETRRDDVAAHKLLALSHLRLGEAWKAVALLNEIADQVADDAQYMAILGTAHLQNGEYDRGLELLRQAIDRDPDNTALQRQLGLGYFASGDIDKAQLAFEAVGGAKQKLPLVDVMGVMRLLQDRQFDKALQRLEAVSQSMRDSALLHNLRGAAELGKGNRDAARAAFERALEISPRFTPAAMNLAALAIQDKDYEGALQRYAAVIKQVDGHSGALLAMARLKEQQGDAETALNLVKEAHEKNPGALAPALLLTRYYMRIGEHVRAISIVSQLQGRHPDNTTVLRALTQAQLAGKVGSNAVQSAQRLVELEPTQAGNHLLLAMALMTIGNDAAARESLLQAIELNQDLVAAHVELVRLEARSNRPFEALRLARRIQRRAEDSATGYTLEGDVHAALGDYNAAVTAYRRAFVRQNQPGLARKLHNAYWQAGKQEDAIDVLRRWLEEHPDDVGAHMALAVSYHASGRVEDAIGEYQTVLEKRPDSAKALNNLAWIYQQRDDARGLEFAERAYVLAPDNTDIADTLGWILVQRGQHRRALKILEKAALYAPEQAEIQYHLAVALSRMERLEEARDVLRRLVDKERGTTVGDKATALLSDLQ